MGQYHLIVNLDRREYICPHRTGALLKAWEQLNNPGPCQALFALLMCSNGRGGGDLDDNPDERVIGRWAGDRIAVVGDYAHDGDLAGEHHAGTVYARCVEEDECWNDLPEEVRALGRFRDVSHLVAPILERNVRLLDGRPWELPAYMREALAQRP